MSCKQNFGIAMIGAALAMAPALAGTLTIGFEQPDYTPGNINGQQGWSKTGPYDAVVAGGAGVNGSAQSLRISNGVTSGSFGDQTFTPQLSVPGGESSIPGAVNTFAASWWFKPVTDQLQDGLFISVSADNGQGARMTWLGMGEDSVDGLYLGYYDWSKSLNDANQDPWVYHPLATNLDLTVWHSIGILVQFVDGPSNDIVTVTVDGTPLLAGTTWEDFYRYGPTSDGGGGGLSPVNSLLFRAGGAAAPRTLGQGFYIDNVTLASTQTPEPGSWFLLAGGLAFVTGRRFRRQ